MLPPSRFLAFPSSLPGRKVLRNAEKGEQGSPLFAIVVRSR